MSSFKVTVIISDGLTLGHVLMTKGVDLEHIVEIPDIPIVMQHRRSEPILLDKPRKPHVIFKHPSGKTLQIILKEHMENDPKQTYKWRSLSEVCVKEGYNKSSVNNAVARMLKAGTIKQVGTGLYKLTERK
jgi:hypothetical protein